MKILILCNVLPYEVSKYLNIHVEQCGGWSQTVIEEIQKSANSLSVVFPYHGDDFDINISDTVYYSFCANDYPEIYDAALEERFKKILEIEKPDIVHIFGTEYPHTLSLIKAFDRPERSVIHIQGLVSVYAKHYFAYLPLEVIKRNTFRDLVRKDGIIRQKTKYEKRGEYEIEALKNTGNVMGRTDWDYSCCKAINEKVNYFAIQEIMREPFYEGKWDVNRCERYSIFMSQGYYPIKGLHLALEALRDIVERYPDAKMYVAGQDMRICTSVKDKIRVGNYQKYVNNLINKWNLTSNVVFLGNQSAEQMKDRMLRCNVFISPSSIENSPNSIGEALLLGVPVVSSDAGGVRNLFEHNKEGYIYQSDAPYMLASYVMKLFSEEDTCRRIGEGAYERAHIQYDKNTIIRQITECYSEIIKR